MDIAIVGEKCGVLGSGLIHRPWLHINKTEGDDTPLNTRRMRGRIITDGENVRNTDKEIFNI